MVKLNSIDLKIFNLESVFDFGKHEDEMIEDVIEDDPDYMEWIYDNAVINLGLDVIQKMKRKRII